MTTIPLSKLLGAMAVPVFIAILVALNILEPAKLDPALIFDPPLLIPTVNLFVSLVSFLVAYISARGYLGTGSTTLVFLGGGVLAYALAYVGSSTFLFQGSSNIAFTISAIQFLVGSILNAMGVVLALRASEESRPVRGKIVLLYVGVLILMVLVTVASSQGAFPPFFIPGVGSTPPRMWVLGTAVCVFALSSLGVMRLYAESKSDILYWYGLAMALIAVGLAAFFLQRVVGGPIGWVGRLAQYVGSVYFLVAVLATRGARTKGTPP